MLALSQKWAAWLVSQPETGMGYWLATIHLVDGRKFERTIVDSGYITKVGESTKIPFEEADIARIIVKSGQR